ncbi:short chain dehydrogenase domain-containing protein [Phthorimaea operculella]|nr:short chain dehydrogenase domain-containing protein [Phthorimaea operculella]
MIVLIIFAICVTTLIFGLYQKKTNAICKSNKRLDGKVAVVTGGTVGMGLVIATDLARRGAKVIIACPFEEEGKAGRKSIIEATGNYKVIFELLDLASISSIRKFAAEVLEKENRLDILINNAGVGGPINTKSYNGTNFIMHVNFIGHFLLTILLLPLLKKTGTDDEPSRIVNTASILHWLGTVDFEYKNREDCFYRLFCYSNSKFCCMLFAHELSKKLKISNVVVNAVDPGGVGTAIFHDLLFGKFISLLCKVLFKTAHEGAQTALHVALDDMAGKFSGQFFKNCKLDRAKRSAYDDELGRKLWEESVKIVKLDTEELKSCVF